MDRAIATTDCTMHEKFGPLCENLWENLTHPQFLAQQLSCAGDIFAPGPFQGPAFRQQRSMKTAITIVADLVRSLVLSGLAAVGFLVLIGLVSAVIMFGLWRLWRRLRT